MLSDDERVPNEAYDGDPFEMPPDFPTGLVSRGPRQPESSIQGAESVASPSSLPSPAAARKRKPSSSKEKTSTAKRSRLSQGSTPASSSSPAPLRRFTVAITKRYMEVMVACKAEGLLNPTNKKQWTPVWEKIISVLSSEYPQYKWTKKLVQSKFQTEKKRYSRFITFLARTGTSYNEETGKVEGSEETFDAMEKRYPDSKWLRTTPLGDRGVYEEVFWRENVSGEEIDAISVSEGLEEEDVSTEGEEDIEDTQPSRRRRTREDSGDPDLALANGSASSLPTVMEVPVMAARRRGRERLDEVLGSSMENAAVQLTKTSGADAVTTASADLQARYGGREGLPGRYSPGVVISCLEKFAASPIFAVVWNTMQKEFKDAKMEQWAREMGAG